MHDVTEKWEITKHFITSNNLNLAETRITYSDMFTVIDRSVWAKMALVYSVFLEQELCIKK